MTNLAGIGDQGPTRRGAAVRYAFVAGATSVAIGTLTMFGWWSGLPRLTDVLAGWPSMKPVTALLCVLAGLALALRAWPGSSGRARIVSSGCAAAAGVLALITVVEHVFGVRAGFDRLIAGVPVGLPLLRTAASFLVVSAALLSLDHVTARGQSPAQFLALVAGVIPSIALLGYAFGLPELHSARQSQAAGGMAVHTAVALALLSSGTFTGRPTVGLMSALAAKLAGGLVARRLLLGLAAFAPVAVLVIAGRHLGWYQEHAVAPLLVFLALVTGLLLILVTAVRLNSYDLRQKATEALLRRSDQRVRELISAAPDGIFVAGLDGRYTDVNDAGCRLLGMSRDDIVGKSIVDLIPEADVERLQQSKTRLLTGAVDTSEWALRRRDGAYVPVEVSTSILPDGRSQAFVRDISERKRIEAALARAQDTDRQLRADLERVTRAAVTVSEAVADLPIADISAVLHTIALQAQALTGAEYVAIGLGTDPDKPFDPWVVLGVSQEVAERIGRHPRPIGTLGDVARDGATVRVADVNRHPDFRGFPPHHPAMTSLLGVPIRYRGRPLGNLYLTNKGSAEFSLQDQRRVEMLAARAAVAIETANLYAGEARQRAWLRNIIDQMPEGVVILDAGGHAVATNRAMLAYAHDDTGARDPWGNAIIFDVRRPDGTRVAFEELPVVQALEHGEGVVGRELALHQTDGRVIPVLANSAPVRDEDGRITGATLVVQDITALKELERLREEWASIVAHDLRQPVGAISLAAEALLRWCASDESSKERRALARIRSSADRLTRMIGDLLDASRIEAKRLSVTPATTDLCELTDAVVDSLRTSAGEHELRVAVPAEFDAWIDADRIRQVLTNLISNALKYGEPGTPIVIGGAEHDGFVEMTVTNQGPGIPADELPLMFSRFGRAHDARTTGKPGTGLGLYICKGLVEAHGGRIWVDSVPGQLTSFHFLLPKQPSAAGTFAATENPAPV